MDKIRDSKFYRSNKYELIRTRTTSGGSIISSTEIVNCMGRKTLFLKADSDGVVHLEFLDPDDIWCEVFSEDTLADKMYINTFRDMFGFPFRVRWTKSTPGEAIMSYCYMFSES